MDASVDTYEDEADRAASAIAGTPSADTVHTISAESGLGGHADANVGGLRGSGEPLSPAMRAFFEPKFRFDFSNVRIHHDEAAARVTRSLGAHAVTLGNEIAFNAGEYAPESARGKHVLAHELTHVVQQRSIGPRTQCLSIERHAFAKGECGSRIVEWVFSLSKAASADGYIVQHVVMGQTSNSCSGADTVSPVKEFWEAWPVIEGDTVDWTTLRDGSTDGSSLQSYPNSKGTQNSSGTVKFFLKSVTGDLGDYDEAPADPKSPWGPGKVATSGYLPSTAGEPKWWSGSAEEGPASRLAASSWDCCDADAAKHRSDVTVTP